MKKLLIRILKRNHQLYQKWKLYERLALCLVREEDNAFQRNKKAIEYIDNIKKDGKGISIGDRYRFEELREILTTFKTDNVLDEVNGD